MLSKLVEDFFNMKEEILSRDFDLGFSGNSEDVVMRALHLLGNCVNVTSSANRNGEFTIAPSHTVPALFELNFYSNGLFHVFISDAIIGTLHCCLINGFFLCFSLLSDDNKKNKHKITINPKLNVENSLLSLQPVAFCHCSGSAVWNQRLTSSQVVLVVLFSVRRDSYVKLPASPSFLPTKLQ